MNAQALPEVLLGVDSPQEPQLPFASEGVQRYVWEGRFGPMLIEVKDGAVFVNGQPVEPHVAVDSPARLAAMDEEPSLHDGVRIGRQAGAAAPVARASVAIGFGSPSGDSGVTRLDLNDILVRNPQASFLKRVAGDSMRDAGIDDGDLVLIDRAVAPVHGHVVIAVVEQEFVCRHLVKRPGELRLQAADRSVADIVPTEGEGFEIWGVVTNAIKSFPV